MTATPCHAAAAVAANGTAGAKASGGAADPVSEAYSSLRRRDRVLRHISGQYGEPDPFAWDDGGRTGTSNFAALLLHIAGQQISTAVAFVLFDRIAVAVGGLPGPESVVALGPVGLRSVGLSAAKAAYMFGLAEMQLAGAVDVDGLGDLDDRQAVAALTSVRGVGRWSAEMFLIHQLHRPDVLPAGDLGIRRAVEAAWELPALPAVGVVAERARGWSPYRSYAAALLWASRRQGRGHHNEGAST